MAFLGDVSRINRYQEMYSNAIVQVAFKKRCDFVDVRKKFLQSGAPGRLPGAPAIGKEEPTDGRLFVLQDRGRPDPLEQTV